MGPMGTYQIFAAGGAPIGGMMNDATQAPSWIYYFNVPALDAAAGRIVAHGGQVVCDPHEVPGGSWFLRALDPQGAMFALVAPRR